MLLILIVVHLLDLYPKGFEVIDKKTNETKTHHFYIGNGFFKLNKDIPKIPLDVALAASSCFPGGFEPIILRMDEHIVNVNPLHDTVGMLDGGIVDNQGIDAIISFNEKNKLDYVFVVDSASPDIEKYCNCDEKSSHIPLIGRVPLSKLFLYNGIFNVISLLGLIVSFWCSNILTFIFTLAFSISTILSVVMFMGKRKIETLLEEEKLDASSIKPLGSLTPNNIIQLCMNRLTSVKSLVATVFMKHIRRLNTSNIFKVYNLTGRIMVNTLYQMKVLTENEIFLKLNNSQKGEFKEYLDEEYAKDPSLKKLEKTDYNAYYEKMKVIMNNKFNNIPDISKRAFKMGTSLWVEKNENGKALIKDVIVTGQINTCINILNNTILKDEQPEIYSQVVSDWEKFKKNPYWLFDELMANPNDVQQMFRNLQQQQEVFYNQSIKV